MPTPAELLPAGSWVVVVEAERTLDRARQARDEAEALAEALGWPGPDAMPALDDALSGRVQLRLTEFTEGVDTGPRGTGERRRATRRSRANRPRSSPSAATA